MALDPKAAARLAKVLGLLGSEHAGERAAAAATADRLLRENGWTWADFAAAALTAAPGPAQGAGDAAAARAPEPPADPRDRAAWVLERLPDATAKERDFLASLTAWSSAFSAKQMSWLDALAARAMAGRSAPRRAA
jgi:hypothetical protein